MVYYITSFDKLAFVPVTALINLKISLRRILVDCGYIVLQKILHLICFHTNFFHLLAYSSGLLASQRMVLKPIHMLVVAEKASKPARAQCL